MKAWEIKAWAGKYGGTQPCNRRSYQVQLSLNLGPFAGPQSGFMRLEVPQGWLEQITKKEAYAFMEGLERGFELLVAGAVRLAYRQERETILKAAVQYGRYYLEEKFEQPSEDSP